jgi:hypothetical protein
LLIFGAKKITKISASHNYGEKKKKSSTGNKPKMGVVSENGIPAPNGPSQ